MNPFDSWEDFAAGMYRQRLDAEHISLAEQLLRDCEAFREAATEMVREWPTSARQNLDHMWSGRNAWLGQATCCYSVGATSAETRAAWGLMDNGAQRSANEVARLVRLARERGHHDAQASLAM
jgi:hypothetical protein